MKRWKKWRNRLTSEVVILGGFYWRVTKQRGRIVGIERWVHISRCGDDEPDTVYGYSVWKGPIK